MSGGLRLAPVDDDDAKAGAGCVCAVMLLAVLVMAVVCGCGLWQKARLEQRIQALEQEGGR